MNIKYVEELVGITKKNIRFYEDQGLLAPGRAENGYREYHDGDVRRLKQIKLLRKLLVPIDAIRDVLAGKLTLEDCLDSQLREIDRQRADLDAMRSVGERMLASRPAGAPLTLEKLDADAWLETIAGLEKEGRAFVDLKTTDVHRKKTVGSLLAALVMIALMALLIAVLWWGDTADTLPRGLFIALLAVPSVVIICVVVVLVQRIREIQRGEEDEAAQY